MIAELLSVPAGLFVAQIATFATTVYLHRCQTHSAFVLSPAVDRTFRILVWITTGQRTKEWVAVHRKHHAHSDEEGDPHSPVQLGFWKVQLFNAYLYVKEARNPETMAKYARDIREDAWDRILFNHGLLGLGIGIFILYLTFGGWGCLIAVTVHILAYVGILTSCINAIGHHKVPTGYQNYSRQDASNTYNYRWLAYLTGGEGLHNNHHGQPKSAKFSHLENEPDPGWKLIVWLQKMGWATHVQMPKSQLQSV
jgi:stearoyl-CoA desaturase (delta-9 desaturase)